MGYGAMMGLMSGIGKGAGPGVAASQSQGGMAGIARMAGGALEGVGKGLTTLNPKMSAAMNGTQQGVNNTYHEMMETQNRQDSEAQLTNIAKQIFGERAAKDKYFKNSTNPSGISTPESI